MKFNLNNRIEIKLILKTIINNITKRLLRSKLLHTAKVAVKDKITND